MTNYVRGRLAASAPAAVGEERQMLPNIQGYRPKIDHALTFAAIAHGGQTRKGSKIPYITHPVHVAMILIRHGFGEDVVIAGLLHDVVEDCDVPIDEIEERFGHRVKSLVASVTERKQTEEEKQRPWRVRKEEQLSKIRGAGFETAALKAADALHNCQTTLADLEALGDVLWERFNAGPEEQRWYYGALASALQEALSDHPLARELSAAVAKLG